MPMRTVINIISGFSLFLLIVIGGLAADVRDSAAQAICALEFTKEAEGLPSGTDFIFDATIIPDDITFAVHIPVNGINGVNLGENDTLSLTESPQHGFEFGGVECDAAPSVTVTEFEDGFSIQCSLGTEVVTRCVVRNVKRANPIPTLSEWGLVAAAGGLLLIGAYYATRKRLRRI